MNVINAAKAMQRHMHDNMSEWEQGEYNGYDHLINMCYKIIDKTVEGDKAHRWLGWVQGCVYCDGTTTLEELKLINKNSD